ncbi:MAG TPA: LPXTG cell wall anchor domain-containing protein [Actinophytocola sp.]|uniref:LPXTG cell wall anchor domain-containing protein n=1 Tax=Actinophytocola sp. TaxID=1872138 RepID=UPI002DBEC64E|nr:LPXTG cell wall anchor domain-containing protein [Actinophytocola sp.]HEU5475455.1 LPXTG cell wall anchor domain-containing protein [Actinophytocola sp.]
MRLNGGTRPLTLAAVAALTAAALAWPATGPPSAVHVRPALSGPEIAFQQTVTGPPNMVAMLTVGIGVVSLGIGLILLGRRRRRHARR